ncbi:arginine kinase [Drosophila ficusphila]|uniref:arginine kinase n=1 Tax=Drosophila ficusphila TaxID=30025 RepID=UPI0007E8096D|nr:arginine kinase [Drosophila ficusphila]
MLLNSKTRPKFKFLTSWILATFRHASKKVDKNLLKQMEDDFQKLADSKSKSLLRRHLTKEIFDKLKTQTTPSYNSTLMHCISSGLCNHDSGVGLYAPDPEAYKVFADLFDPVIEDYHKCFRKTDKQPETAFGKGKDFENLDPDGNFIVSTRVRCGRALKGFPFNPCLTEEDYNKLQSEICAALKNLKGEYKGCYESLSTMDKCSQQKLIDDHLLFKEGDRFLEAAGASRFWPIGRGIYLNDAKNFVVWVNEEDHIRIISMEKGGDLGKVYDRMVGGVEALGKQLQFNRDERLGFLTFCPTNLGTSIRASVHIKLPKLMNDPEELKELSERYRLQIRGTSGEHSEAKDGVHDISNQRRLGLTEYEIIKEMHTGIKGLIEAEKKAKSC